ncbi:diacylglycerol/lipid kinase family protein [Rufibacter psychrotolerans]|uniref:diacylglycerol/lipid kinase family protein n=1 Tax=Rufibacter psychrotolerans TaxID=2812556 RepID=UPI001967D369|nr:diacylglycerol kinase family protein [Rufibacter sp. SYSU D00308]
MTKVLFVINPISGDIEKGKLVEHIKSFCQQEGIAQEVFNTTGEKDEEKLKAKIASCEPQVVCAVGGDGTVSLVAKSIIKTNTALAIIPLGSGNGLSKDIGIPQDFEAALHLLKEHKIMPIDTLDVNGLLSIHLCDMGFNALVVKRFCNGETRGPGAYAWIAMQEFMGYEPKHYTIITNGKTIFDGKAFMITITNAKAFGSNATINPTGVINDGSFEICILEPFPKASSLGILYRLYTDTIDGSVYTHRFSCREATIINHAQEVAQIDGEPEDLGQEVTFTVQPRSLRVVLPKE